MCRQFFNYNIVERDAKEPINWLNSVLYIELTYMYDTGYIVLFLMCMSGTFQCGPMPVVAIKHGDISQGYDGGFIFGEVNADKVYWKVDGMDMKVVKIISNGYAANSMVLSYLYSCNGNKSIVSICGYRNVSLAHAKFNINIK